MAPIPNIGGVTTVRRKQPVEQGSGFLNVLSGEQVKIVHIGSGDKDRGWLFAHAVTGDTTRVGWMPVSSILTERSLAEASEREHIHKAVRPVAAWPGNCQGYLVPVHEGELLQVLHVGAPGTDESGWVFAKRVSTPEESGWLAAEVLALPTDSPAPAADSAAMSSVRPSGTRDDDDDDGELAVDDWVYHLRPGGLRSRLRSGADENSADVTGGTLGHNERCRVLARSGVWVRVGTSGGLEGWVRNAHLRSAPLPPGPVKHSPPAPPARSPPGRPIDAEAEASSRRRSVTFVLDE